MTACDSKLTNSEPAAAVERYFTALVAKEANQVSTASCADWEVNAQQELRTFDAVDVDLENLTCQLSSPVDELNAVVTCSGTITANYGKEVLEINLADRTYQAAYEGGEWRFCGYR